MLEVKGNIWDTNCEVIAITTNGTIKNNGELVMGKGIALQAKQKYPDLPEILGDFVLVFGNTPKIVYTGKHMIVSLPTKNSWRDKSDINLIKKSLLCIADCLPSPFTIAIPRPGCANGGLNWKDVKKEIEPLLSDRFVIYSL